MATKINPADDDFGLMVNFAVRYALGRHTYAPSSVAVFVSPLLKELNDMTLFVKDEPYHVVVALEDAAGAIVHLEQVAPSGTPYAGEAEFSVAATNLEIALSHLTPGNYRVVAYIATSEGIRSSKFASVAFDAVEGAVVNFGDVDLRGSVGNDGTLTLTYTERIDVNVTI